MFPFPRVLMVSYWYPPSVGGLPQQAHLLARKLASQEVPVSVVTTYLAGHKNFEICDGVTIHRLLTFKEGYRRRLYTWLFPLAFFLIRRRGAYNVLHIHQALYPAAVSVTVAKLFAKKTIVKVSGSGASGNMATLRERWLGWLARAIIARADCFISLSEEMTAELKENGFDLHRVVRIPNGVEMEIFQPAMAKPELAGRRVVITVGRLTYEKGNDILIRAWPNVVKQLPDVYLFILAEGQDRETLVSLAQQLGVSASITFVGNVPQSEVAHYLAASTVFVLPSRNEGMSNALLEAMAAGKPCLASDIQANREVIQPGINGMLFKSDDPDDLATQLVELLRNDDLRARFGAEARQTAITRFSIEAVVQRYKQLYYALLENHPISAALSAPVEEPPAHA